MYPAKVRVRALLRHVAVEFEREVLLSAKPFVGLAVGLGRQGEDVPQFLAEASWSAVFACYVCRAEDDHAAEDYGDDDAALVADYAMAGWREARRVGPTPCPPHTHAR